MTGTLAMFPLASVLFPGAPMALRVFESRYLAMLAEVSADGAPEFGVVLIDRGREVGGDDTRFDVATVARVVRMEPGEGAVSVVAVGGARVQVTRWLLDDPYPRAEVEPLQDLQWEESWRPRLEQTYADVLEAREALRHHHDGEPLPDDPVSACWHVAATAPVGPLDRLAMLQARTAPELLDVVAETTRQVLMLHRAFDA